VLGCPLGSSRGCGYHWIYPPSANRSDERRGGDVHELSLPELMHFREEGDFPSEELDDSDTEEDLRDEFDALVGEDHGFASEEEELPHCESLEGSEEETS
jgi:hypothetical protein